MGFYKTTIIVAIIHLIIFLAILGVLMSQAYNSKSYIVEQNTCPDYYTFDGTNCNANTSIYDTTSLDSGKTDAERCSVIDFTTSDIYKVSGTDGSSGLCAKKNRAIDCGVSWDGITNNSDICKDS